MSTSHEIAHKAAHYAGDKKADQVTVLDMTRVSGVCDFFVVCSATSNVRAKAIAEHVAFQMKTDGIPLIHREGLKDGRWILLDFGEVVVHIFQEEARKYYDLENLWGDAPRKRFPGEPHSEE